MPTRSGNRYTSPDVARLQGNRPAAAPKRKASRAAPARLPPDSPPVRFPAYDDPVSYPGSPPFNAVPLFEPLHPAARSPRPHEGPGPHPPFMSTMSSPFARTPVESPGRSAAAKALADSHKLPELKDIIASVDPNYDTERGPDGKRPRKLDIAKRILECQRFRAPHASNPVDGLSSAQAPPSAASSASSRPVPPSGRDRSRSVSFADHFPSASDDPSTSDLEDYFDDADAHDFPDRRLSFTQPEPPAKRHKPAPASPVPCAWCPTYAATGHASCPRCNITLPASVTHAPKIMPRPLPASPGPAHADSRGTSRATHPPFSHGPTSGPFGSSPSSLGGTTSSPSPSSRVRPRVLSIKVEPTLINMISSGLHVPLEYMGLYDSAAKTASKNFDSNYMAMASQQQSNLFAISSGTAPRFSASKQSAPPAPPKFSSPDALLHALRRLVAVRRHLRFNTAHDDACAVALMEEWSQMKGFNVRHAAEFLNEHASSQLISSPLEPAYSLCPDEHHFSSRWSAYIFTAPASTPPTASPGASTRNPRSSNNNTNANHSNSSGNGTTSSAFRDHCVANNVCMKHNRKGCSETLGQDNGHDLETTSAAGKKTIRVFHSLFCSVCLQPGHKRGDPTHPACK